MSSHKLKCNIFLQKSKCKIYILSNVESLNSGLFSAVGSSESRSWFACSFLCSVPNSAAFRIHVPPESLEQARLRVGDVCEIKSDNGKHGLGIAWRAGDRLTKKKNTTRTMKWSDFFMVTFGFKEGDKATMTARYMFSH